MIQPAAHYAHLLCIPHIITELCNQQTISLLAADRFDATPTVRRLAAALPGNLNNCPTDSPSVTFSQRRRILREARVGQKVTR